MVRTNNLGGPLGPNPNLQTRGPEKPQLTDVEAQNVKEQQTKRLTAQDAARVASQAGFQRKLGAKKGLDIGDGSRAPIPIPDDELDPDAWSQEKLEDAQGSLSLAGAQFGEVAKGGTEAGSLGENVVGSSFMPTDDGLAGLQKLAERDPPPPMEMEDVTTDMARLFNIELPDTVPLGHKVLATGLVVAGEAGAVKVLGEGIDEQSLAAGLQKITEKGNQAVGEAQRMSKGINLEVKRQQTFVPKR